MENDGQDSWVVLETFSWFQQALLLKTFLEGAGIQSVIPEEHMATIDPSLTAMKVRLLVKCSDLEEARKLVDDAQASSQNVSDNSDEAQEACPHCGSLDKARGTAAKSNWLRFILGLLTGVPMRSGKKYFCKDCGREL